MNQYPLVSIEPTATDIWQNSVQEPIRMPDQSPEAMPVPGRKTGNDIGRFVMQIDVVVDDTPVSYKEMDDLPDFQAGMAAVFDPEVSKDKLDEAIAQREQVRAANRIHQADLLTATTAERLEAKHKLNELDAKVLIATNNHTAARMVANVHAQAAQGRVVADKGVLPPLSNLIKPTKILPLDQRRIDARREVVWLEKQVKELKTAHTVHIADLMHASAGERLEALRELKSARSQLRKARHRQLAAARYDGGTESEESLESGQKARVARMLGALALRQLVAPSEESPMVVPLRDDRNLRLSLDLV